MIQSSKAARQSPVSQLLGVDGPIARALPGYEERPGQIEMATMVLRALTKGEHAVIEAGTGTGKSLAYLVPAIYSGKTVIVSTANKALQEQLIRKDIPFLQKVLPIQFSAAVLKGRGNYLCLDRLREEEAYQRMMGGTRGWSRLLEWRAETPSGDFEDLEISLPVDLRARVMSTTRTCVGQVCDLFEECFVEHAYQRAESAKIIICNHALLLADLHLRDLGARVLPDRDAIVVDEAHRLEETAIDALSVQLSPGDITELMENTVIRRNTDAGLLDRAARAGTRLAEDLRRVAGSFQRVVTEALPSGEAFSDLLTEVRDGMTTNNPHKNTERSREARRYGMVLEWLTDTISTARLVSRPVDEDSVRYSLPREGGRDKGPYLRWSPIDVSRQLKELLFDRYPTICTSATLATAAVREDDFGVANSPFAYYRSRAGCEDPKEAVIPSPFDYPSQCLLYVPRTMPEFSPQLHEQFCQALAEHLERLIQASRGRAFCLFTSYKTLDRVHEMLAPKLEYPSMRQGEAPRPELLRRFTAKPGSVLFATRSFWEGVDVAGSALSLVAIDKMPFSAPDDPVIQARVERMKREGKDWFNDLMLPQATLQLKQGFGRLIRSASDRGVVAILDSRIIRKGYGRRVVEALPPARRTDKIEVVDQFFAAP
ncbi:MAG TPA: ATP-dependent DNA helicase [Chloroflexota bacterium]